MSGSQVSFTDFDSIMKAAEREASNMNDNYQNSSEAKVIGSTENATPSINVSEDSINAILNNNNVNTDVKAVLDSNKIADEVKAALSNNNISSMMQKMTNNPEQLGKMMNESLNSLGQLSPDMMEKARKMAATQGKDIVNQMQRKGMNPHAMREQMLQQQKMMKALTKKNEKTKKGILITSSRQLKVKDVPVDSIRAAACKLVKSTDVVELSCSRLAAGELKEKSIKIWYNPSCPGKNKRASKIVGFPIAGDLLIIMEEGDLNEKDFLVSENLLE